MKAYIKTRAKSFAIQKVVKYMQTYAPDNVEIVDRNEDADLVVIHVVGRCGQNKRFATNLLRMGKRYVMAQYVIRGTRNPSTADWIPMWEKAEMVWSYYNLNQLVEEDGNKANFHFYRSPLGVDANIFKVMDLKRDYLICMTGDNYVAKSNREIILVAKRLNRRLAHLGRDLNQENIDNYRHIAEDEVAKILNKSEFVSGLRRVEGFELLVAEGILCGARPLLFDRPHYKDWYGEFGIFIPESRSNDDVVENLRKVFRAEYKPITSEQIELAKERFNWQKIMTGFWNNLN